MQRPFKLKSVKKKTSYTKDMKIVYFEGFHNNYLRRLG